jgi:threonylcarbamoyladenosine tRNA methylthiotransferase MtaB
MRKVALETLGCKVNHSETSAIGRQFVEYGYRIVTGEEPADVYVLNTCSVTGRADQECRQLIRRALRKSPETYVAVVGCYAQLQPGEISSIPGVDLVLGAKEKFNIFAHAGAFEKRGTSQVFVSCIDEPLDFVATYSGENDGRTRAFLKVQDGCDYTCSFCTIPRARGASRSHGIADVLANANLLADQGYKEIVLTGVNVGDYGRKIGASLLELLRELDRIPVERFRISSIEPNLLTSEIVDFVLSSNRFCPHFHIPMQSGSDSVLAKMRRRYRTHDYRQLVERIRALNPQAAIGADVLVGFPGESDALFEETHSFIGSLPISYLHVFTYSERENTDAAEWGNAVDKHVRSQRNEGLRALSEQKKTVFASSFLSTVQPVLYEGEPVDGVSTGLTPQYVRVESETSRSYANKIIDTRLTECDGNVCTGEILSSHELLELNGELITA